MCVPAPQATRCPPPPPASPLLLARLLHVVGQLVQAQLVHLEGAVSREIKRKRGGAEGEGRGPASAHKGRTPARTPKKVGVACCRQPAL